jgi:4-hydroxybenzoate polyprenyltransferase
MMLRNRRVLQLIGCIRWIDVLILLGAPVLGVAFSSGPIMPANLVTCSIFGAASLLLVAHVFTLNDWADFARGVHHSNRAMLQLESKDITPRLLLVFSFLLLVVSILFFLFLPGRCLLLAVAVAALGISYSHPSLNAKSMPIVSTLLHLLGGSVYFLLGYALFSPIDLRGILLGLFFGLTFAAGHPIQEVRDILEDRQVGAKTNAVVFGPRPTFFAGIVLFTAQYIYLFVLAWSGLIPRFLAILSVVCYPIHLSWSLLALRRGLNSEVIIRFQNRYRLLYALIGLAMFLSIFGRP